MTQTLNAIIYCRVSSKGQLEWWWLSSQETACREYCKKIWYNVINVFYDSSTGWDLNRPWINALFDFIDETSKINKVDVFVVEDISRIARDYTVHLEIKKNLLSRYVQYETVSMRFEDTPTGKFIEAIMAINAEFFRNNNTQQVFSRTESRLIDGYRTWNTPLWYKYTNAPGGWKMLIKDEPNASIIQETLMWYHSGLLNSVKEVADYLQRKWLDTSKYEWRRKNKQKEYKIHTSLAHRMLKNILYSWDIEYKAIKKDKHGIIVKIRDISRRKWRHEGIITPDIYDAIQEKLSGKRPYTHEIKTVNEEYPLRGFIVCECCWKPLTTGKSRSGNKERRILYYQFNKQCKYHGKSINANTLHDNFLKDIQNLEVSKEFIAFMKLLVVQEYEKRKQDKKVSKVALEKSIAKIEQEIENLLNTLSSSTSAIVQKRIEQKIEDLECEKQRLQKAIKQYNEAKDLWQHLEVCLDILQHTKEIRETWSIDEKHMLLRLLLKNKLVANYHTKTYWTPEYTAFYLIKKELSVDNSSLVDTQQDILNKHNLDFLSIEEEIEKFYHFGILLARGWNILRYQKYKDCTY